MPVSTIGLPGAGPSFGRRGIRVLGLLPALMLLVCGTVLVALETPSKPFLDKNSFLLSSAGFRVQLVAAGSAITTPVAGTIVPAGLVVRLASSP